MKYELKIALPMYKIIYSMLFYGNYHFGKANYVL